MDLATGTRLGPYELLSPLGKGGMGEVYRARDTRLDRTVAVKVLPQHFSSSPERRQRFEREARAVSSLSHPNICALYDVGHQDGMDYLVMEYIEGESLADRLAKGPLSIDQALKYAIQIADALDKAHRAGIIHRDLKPANIMLTKAGAKLLDFGLAKLRGNENGAALSDQSNLPTERISLTGEGTIVGTFQYMAPEQLESGPVDARADIFAFGAVLYEMITGRRAFTGKSTASLIVAILERDPEPVSAIKPMTPPALDRLIKKCLAKEPDERWQSAGDVADELRWVLESGTEAVSTSQVAARGKNRERLAWIVAAVGLLGFAAALPFAVAYFRDAPADQRVFRLSVLLPEKVNLTGTVPSMALSPDGRRLAFVGTSEGKNLIWVRSFDSPSAQPLAGSEGVSSPSAPFWSPDGRFIVFSVAGKLKKIDAAGGPAQTLCDVSGFRGGTWNRDGVILFGSITGPIYRVPASGGEATPVTALDQSRFETSHRSPFFLPDGRHFLYLVRSNQADTGGVYVGSLDSKATKRLLPAVISAAYTPPGYLLFLRSESLMAQPFDADKLELTGEPFAVAEQVAYNSGLGRGAFTVSENGVLAFRGGSGQIDQPLWFDRTGIKTGSLGEAGIYFNLSFSPDERHVAVDLADPQTGTNDIWLFDLSRGIPSRFTTNPWADSYPVWSPDGRRVVYGSSGEGVMNIYQKAASGVGGEVLLLKSGQEKIPDDLAADGRFLMYETLNPNTKWDLWVLPMSGGGQPFPFLQTEFNERHAQFSPDSKWVAYTSEESGMPEVYVQTFPASGGRWRVSSGGGAQPRWRRDGRELFYIATDRKLMAVDIKPGEAFEAGVPRPLFDTRALTVTDFSSHYAVTADGQRFLINSILEERGLIPISIVVNWAADLKR